MARTGQFGGFYFDPDVFSGYMKERPYLKNEILLSGIYEEDATINNLIGSKGNVGTMPFYIPLDVEADNMGALNYDGLTDNVPVDVAGGKQTFMAIFRMKAFKEKDFTKELSGAQPLQDVAGKLEDYYRQVWTKVLLKELDAVLGTSAMASHKTDLSVTTGSITDANKISETSLVELGQKACGDMADRFNLVIMHSKIFTALKKLQLVEYGKFVTKDALVPEITLPTVDGKIVLVDDRGTVDTSVDGYPVYKTYYVGKGSFIGCSKALEDDYYVDFNAEKFGGLKALYTKQAKVIHPNGFSFAVDNVSNESPTDTEIGTSSNWTLKFNEKNITLALLKTNG